MDDSENNAYDQGWASYLRSRVSRAQLLKAAGVGIAAAAMPAAASAAATPTTTAGPAGGYSLSFPFYPQVKGSYTPEDIPTMINIAQTAEHLAVTFLTAGVNNAGTMGISGLVLDIVKAALAEEIYHVQFLDAAGAKPLTDNFSVPDPKMLTDYTTFFKTVEVADTLFNAAYMAACRQFAELGQPTLAKIAYQIGSVEAEHRTLARAALALKGVAGENPPDNKAFETDLFVHVADAAAVLSGLGFLGTGAVQAPFVGLPTAIAAAGSMFTTVVQTTPNNATTSVTATDNLTGPRT